MAMFFVITLISFILVGCDADIKKITQLGSPQSIECWSGDTKIYSGKSTGKVRSESTSDGYYFEESGSGRLLEVSGNCIISSTN